MLAGRGSITLGGDGTTTVVRGANGQLNAAVDIQAGNAARLTDFKGLGTGAIRLDGELSITGAASGDLSNTVTFGSEPGGVLDLVNSRGAQSGTLQGESAAIRLTNRNGRWPETTPGWGPVLLSRLTRPPASRLPAPVRWDRPP